MNPAGFQRGGALTLRAGAQARQLIAREGVRESLFGTMLGASGGPKWLILAGIDRHLAGTFFRDREKPLALLGTSIGCWRHAIHAQRDPLAALDRFLAAYLNQRYSPRPGIGELTGEAERLLDVLLGELGIAEIIDNPVFRTHILAARCRGLCATERRAPLFAGLALAALLNLASRRSLALSFERALFAPAAGQGQKTDSDFRLNGLPAFDVPLDAANLREALLASAAVPLVFAARRNIARAPKGVYRDGGITDYHFDLDLEAPRGLVLYPHFSDRIVPGWFDKSLRWRRADGPLSARTLLVAPSPAFIASLPARAIPDRRDFVRFDDATRESHWQVAVRESERLADAFAAWCESDDPARWLEDLPTTSPASREEHLP